MHFLKIVFIIVTAAALTKAKTFAEVTHNKCRRMYGLSDNETTTMTNLLATIPNDIDVRYKCYMHCIMIGWGHLDEDGRFRIEWIKEDQHLSEDHLKVLENCIERHNGIDDQCEYVFTTTICAMEGYKDLE
uniref:Uncharacterized protein n=1 Tax=Musca domestica TaxID=7370 RepID=A0A1I8NBX2_MUSDO